MKNLTLGIIGGDGKMGQIFSKAFRPFFKKIITSSIDGTFTNIELAKQSQVVLLAVPINAFEAVISEILPYLSEDQLLMDITSIKEEPCHLMEKTKAYVIGMHPMFGPNVATLRNQTIALCPTKPGKFLQPLKDICNKLEMEVVETTPEKHDQMMAYVQCLAHITNIAFVNALERSGMQIKDFLPFASPVFLMQLQISTRVLSQDGAMYQEMQMRNPHFTKVLENLTSNLQSLSKSITSQNRKEFLEVFTHGSSFVETLKVDAKMATDAFMASLKERKF